nr:hypothetical protein CFP56_22573 [Quercus suber]
MRSKAWNQMPVMIDVSATPTPGSRGILIVAEFCLNSHVSTLLQYVANAVASCRSGGVYPGSRGPCAAYYGGRQSIHVDVLTVSSLEILSLAGSVVGDSCTKCAFPPQLLRVQQRKAAYATLCLQSEALGNTPHSFNTCSSSKAGQRESTTS